MTFEPLRITIQLATPVVLNHPWIHFDGLLSHLISLEVMGRGAYMRPTFRRANMRSDQLGWFDQTLGKLGGIQCASASILCPNDLHAINYYHRFEADRFPKPRKISAGSGHYRTWRLRHVYASAETCTFYALAQRDRIERLMLRLEALGDDTRVGWGRVHAVTIEPIRIDRSVVSDGQAMRPIPVRMLRSYSNAAYMPWRVPYWYESDAELCAAPGAEVELRDGQAVA